jgi:3-deoxy-manno-octulosonate cytidylyltransferase (CMP-KDO synthetase)
MNVVVVIPARMGSTRLPGKPLADIGGAPMIVRVWQRASLARLPQRVLVATDDPRVAQVVKEAGGVAVMTRTGHVSGSDRVWEAVEDLDAAVVVNVQGDEPFVDPLLIDRLARAALAPGVDVATAGAPLVDPGAPPSVVRVAVDPQGWALAFARDTPSVGRQLHHVGLYAYRRAALQAFVDLEPSAGERAERLEQLRLLERGFRFRVVEIDSLPLSVDTPEDLTRARARWAMQAST